MNMAYNRAPLTEGPHSQGNAALNSMIGQFKLQIRGLETKQQSLERENNVLERDNIYLRQEVESLRAAQSHAGTFPSHDGQAVNKEQKGSRERDVINHGLYSPSLLDKDAKSPSIPRTTCDALDADILINVSLPHDKDFERKFNDLAGMVSQKLAENGDMGKKETELQAKLVYFRKTITNIMHFHSILLHICWSLGYGTSEDIPPWLSIICGHKHSSSISSLVGNAWRLLQWSLHHCEEGKNSAPTRGEIDEWYALREEEPSEVRDLERTLTKLYAAMCTNSNVLEETEGLATSILSELNDSSPEAASDHPSLSSRIQAQDLFMFKSIMQGLLEKFEYLYAEVTRLRSQLGLCSEDIAEMENDMYLPQREALETYDLGKLIQTMNTVIETLSMKLRAVSAERRLCRRCQQDISAEVGEGPSDDLLGQHRTHHGYASGVIPGRPTYELQSRESMGRASGNVFPAFPRVPFSASEALSTISARPSPGTFRGSSGPLPPRQLTVLQNSTPLVRSKSDTSPGAFHQRKKELLADSTRPKPNSLDSVFTPDSEPFKHHNLHDRTFESDSDEDYEVRGPPDTPPQVRARHDLQKDAGAFSKLSTAPIIQGKHLHQKSGDSGVDVSVSAFTSGVLTYPQPHIPQTSNAPQMSYSQVQQCTGDNSDTVQDMLLPSSVEWSTVQLKGGGVRTPTPEAMSRYSTSMNMAEQSIQNRQCAVCKKRFPLSESPRVIYDHIQGHLQLTTSPDSSLVTLTGVDLEADGLLDRRTRREAPAEACPVCNVVFPHHVPIQARQSHINLHFDDEAGFEVINENYKK